MPVSTRPFSETFETYDEDAWYTSDFTMGETWIHTDWSTRNATVRNGELRLELNTNDSRGKPFTGAEVQTDDRYGYGHYEVTMKASDEPGVNSSFFTYTGPYFGHTWNEIDFEFLGKDPTKVSLAYHKGDVHWSRWVDLGFDASKGYHTYAFSWSDNKITWYADGKPLYTATGDDIPDVPGKVYMNIWTGMNEWLGTPTFTGATTAHYRDVSYTPTIPSMPGAPSTPPPATPRPGTVALFLTDADTGRVIQRITDGATIRVAPDDLDDLTIVAKVEGVRGSVESIKLDIDGAMDRTAVENLAPYALFGDKNGELFGGMRSGNYTLSAEAFAEDGARGTLRASADIDFRIEARTNPAADILVRVVDARSGAVLATLDDGDTLDRQALKTSNLAFLATVTGDRAVVDDVDSIVFELDGPREHRKVENVAPFSLFGDDGTSPHGMSFAAGEYHLEVDAYDHNGGTGPVLASHDFDFTII